MRRHFFFFSDEGKQYYFFYNVVEFEIVFLQQTRSSMNTGEMWIVRPCEEVHLSQTFTTVSAPGRAQVQKLTGKMKTRTRLEKASLVLRAEKMCL
jgi:hypothetical protein